MQDAKHGDTEHPVVPSPSASAKGNSELRAGMRIEHERFGMGVVKAVEGSGENTKAPWSFKIRAPSNCCCGLPALKSCRQNKAIKNSIWIFIAGEYYKQQIGI